MPLRDAGGAIVGATAVISDVTAADVAPRTRRARGGAARAHFARARGVTRRGRRAGPRRRGVRARSRRRVHHLRARARRGPGPAGRDRRRAGSGQRRAGAVREPAGAGRQPRPGQRAAVRASARHDRARPPAGQEPVRGAAGRRARARTGRPCCRCARATASGGSSSCWRATRGPEPDRAATAADAGAGRALPARRSRTPACTRSPPRPARASPPPSSRRRSAWR